MTPTCWLDEDGEHFWFEHECADVAARWAANGHPLEPDTAAHFQAGANKRQLTLDTMLPNTGWHVDQKDPLTISPSILCSECKAHGFFREGKWVPA